MICKLLIFQFFSLTKKINGIDVPKTVFKKRFILNKWNDSKTDVTLNKLFSTKTKSNSLKEKRNRHFQSIPQRTFLLFFSTCFKSFEKKRVINKWEKTKNISVQTEKITRTWLFYNCYFRSRGRENQTHFVGVVGKKTYDTFNWQNLLHQPFLWKAKSWAGWIYMSSCNVSCNSSRIWKHFRCFKIKVEVFHGDSVTLINGDLFIEIDGTVFDEVSRSK